MRGDVAAPPPDFHRRDVSPVEESTRSYLIRLSMIFSENRCPPRYQSCGAGFFLDHALDAERAAQPIATPESVSLVVALNRGAVLSFA